LYSISISFPRARECQAFLGFSVPYTSCIQFIVFFFHFTNSISIFGARECHAIHFLFIFFFLASANVYCIQFRFFPSPCTFNLALTSALSGNLRIKARIINFNTSLHGDFKPPPNRRLFSFENAGTHGDCEDY
jgi:hypothetical protein